MHPGPSGRTTARVWKRTVTLGTLGRVAPPLVVLLLAAALRLWAVDLAPLRYDDVDVLYRSRDVLAGTPTQTGPMTSWGIPDPPGSVYLMLPAAALPSPAASAVAWVALLNVAAVGLTYLMTRRLFGPRTAFVAGLLFAVNPWAVYFSRRSWAEIVPLFTVLALWAAYEVVSRGRSRWAVLFFVALALQSEIRILSFIFVPAALVSLLLAPRRWGIRWPLAGIACGVLLSVPYLLWLMTQWSDVSARLAEGNRGIAEVPGTAALELVLWTAGGYGLLPAQSVAAPWLDPLGLAGQVVLALVGVALVAGLVMTLVRTVRRLPCWRRSLLAAAWLVLPVGTLIAQSSTVYLHYLVALFPALFIVMALPAGWLLERGRVLGSAAAMLVAIVVVVQVATTGLLYRIMDVYDLSQPPVAPLALRQAALGVPREASEQLGTGERYGVEPPIRYWQAIADQTIAEANRAGLESVFALAGATDPLTAEAPAILEYLMRPDVEPHFLPSETLVFPLLRASLVLELPDVDPIESLERFGERRAIVPVPTVSRDAREGARLTLIPDRGPQGWEALMPARQPAALEREVWLVGYRSERTARAGDVLPVTTFWRVGPTAPSTLSVVLRLVDRTGAVVSGDQEARMLPPVDPGTWLLARRVDLTVPGRVPPGEYSLEAAIVGPDGRPVPRADGSGTTLRLTTLRVSGR
ncbi:MAG: glycosyltransferase family 39 protein [Chloroflexi bacterium]|nr:glycosyltransferase family 39 protein [Chloroflexota bacterium]